LTCTVAEVDYDRKNSLIDETSTSPECEVGMEMTEDDNGDDSSVSIRDTFDRATFLAQINSLVSINDAIRIQVPVNPGDHWVITAFLQHRGLLDSVDSYSRSWLRPCRS